MRVYVDLAFAVNAVIDYLLLVCSARLSGAAIHRGRLLLAAALYGFKRYKTILENNKKADIAKEKEN